MVVGLLVVQPRHARSSGGFGQRSEQEEEEAQETSHLCCDGWKGAVGTNERGD